MLPDGILLIALLGVARCQEFTGLTSSSNNRICAIGNGKCVEHGKCIGQTLDDLCGRRKTCCFGTVIQSSQPDESQCSQVNGYCVEPWACNGNIIIGLCVGQAPKQCCRTTGAAETVIVDEEKECKDRGGTCMQTWQCRGTYQWNLCGLSGKACCFSTVVNIEVQDPEKKCKDRGGTCQQPLLCVGSIVWNQCQPNTGKECCIRSASTDTVIVDVEKACKDKGGTCAWECQGTGIRNECGSGKVCCIAQETIPAPPDPEKKCKDSGGTCKQSWLCDGKVVWNLCQLGTGKECCVPREPTEPVIVDMEKECKDRGGTCTYSWQCQGSLVWNYCGTGGKACCFQQEPPDPERGCKARGGTCKWTWQCNGDIVDNQCQSGTGKQCCVPRVRIPSLPDPEKNCKDRGGTCKWTWQCTGDIVYSQCQLGNGKECCVPRGSIPVTPEPEKNCKDKGGACKWTWQCNGDIVYDQCQLGNGKECCVPRDPEKNCKDRGGTCMRSWLCNGNLVWNQCQPGTGKECCVRSGGDPVIPVHGRCKERGGTCKQSWLCEGDLVQNHCQPGSGEECCISPEPKATPCQKYGGHCTDSHCHEILYPHQVLKPWLCESYSYCCMDDPDKKCKEACGKCVEDTECKGKIVTGLCGGKKVCCFVHDPKTDKGCQKKGGANGVCMKIACDGYFVKCNKNTQSAFCPDHKRMQCCMPAGKKPKAGAKDCKGAGGECECNPCDGAFHKNAPGSKLCADGKQCCVIDPYKKCKDGGGKCQKKTVKCNGPYLSGFCGPGAAVCCFEADFTKSPTKGASDTTAKGQRLDTNKFKGTAASEELARQDVPHLNKMKKQINAVAAKTGIDAAIIAAIISRETRGGRAHHLKNSKSYGAMQLDSAKKKNGETSEEHIQEATEHFIDGLRAIFHAHPCWSMETKLKGAIAAYNVGAGNVKTIDGMDKGTTGDDYSDDVIARAKWLKSNGHF